jgi:hypothetical protein
MAVAVTMDFADTTLEQYDEVLKLMGLSPRGAGPAGCISHWVTQAGNGIRVTDVWETRERFEEFAQEQIGPYSAKVGVTQQPQTTFYEVHNYFTPGS